MHHGISTMVIVSFSVSTGRVSRLGSIGIPVVNVGSDLPRRHNFDTTIHVSSGRKSRLTTHRLVALNRHSVTCVHAGHRIALRFDIRKHFRSFVTYYRTGNIRPHILIASRDGGGVDGIIARLLDLSRVPATVTYRRSNVTIPLLFRLRHGKFAIPGSVSVVNCSSDVCTHSLNLAAIHRAPIRVTRRTTHVALSLVRRHPLSRPFGAFPTRLVIHSAATHLRHWAVQADAIHVTSIFYYRITLRRFIATLAFL